MSLGAAGRWAEGVLERLLGPPFQAGHRDQLAVLAYHGIADADHFRRQMDTLLEFRVPVDLDSVIAAIGGRRPLPRHAALVTFDDADRSHLELALPVLRERGISAVAFVVAGLLGTEEPLWWEEVAHRVAAGATVQSLEGLSPTDVVRRLKRVEDDQRLGALEDLRRQGGPSPPRHHLKPEDLPVLEAAGIAVGSHSLTHPCLPRCSTAKIEHEVAAAHRLLGDALGHPPAAFAYPNGDRDPRVDPVLRRHGYGAVFVFDHRFATPGRWDPMGVSRLRVDSTTPLVRFRSIIRGLHPWLHRRLGRR